MPALYRTSPDAQNKSRARPASPPYLTTRNGPARAAPPGAGGAVLPIDRPVDLSVVIPTHQRPGKLSGCLTHLAQQTLPADQYEVLVGLDGEDAPSHAAALAAWKAAGAASDLRVIACPREGLNATRNRVLKEARGRYLVSMNDDVLAAPEFLEAHLGAQRQAERSGRPAVICGYSPFRTFDGDTLFDRLVRETSMIFFYDRMLPAADDRGRDWGFRHCWGLNFSAPLAMIREVGAFIAIPLAYGYDDIELAYRLAQRFRTPVLFRPEARADHDHRYHPKEVLDREERLGRAAWEFAGLAPEFSLALFGRDIRAKEELAYCRQFVAREAPIAEGLQNTFIAQTQVPSWAIRGEHAPALIHLLYQQHLLLKRWHWRRGILAAAEAA
jgi:glycosyltransferase involved in cell wall biosynthesis